MVLAINSLFNPQALQALIEDYQISLRQDFINKEPTLPEEIKDYQRLLRRLEDPHIRDWLSAAHVEQALNPLLIYLRQLGADEYNRIFNPEGDLSEKAISIIYLIDAILQHNPDNPDKAAIHALDQANSDTIHRLFQKEKEQGVHLPEKSQIAPMGRYGYHREDNPIAYPIAGNTHIYRFEPSIKVTVVTMPPSLKYRGLIEWNAIGHEAVGHHLFTADIGLKEEIETLTYAKVKEVSQNSRLAELWRLWVYEFACDLMDVLSLGPQGAAGTIGFLTGVRLATTPRNTEVIVEPNRELARQKMNYVPVTDQHPCDAVRGFGVAYQVGLLDFPEAQEWSRQLREWNEPNFSHEVATIRPAHDGEEPDVFGAFVIVDRFAKDEIKRVTQTVVDLLLTTPLASLDNHSLLNIINWTSQDCRIANEFKLLIQGPKESLPDDCRTNSYCGGHLISGAIQAGLEDPAAHIESITRKMLSLLSQLHDDNSDMQPSKKSFSPITLF